MHGKVWMFSNLIDDEDLRSCRGNLSVISKQWTITDWAINQLSGCLIYRDLFIRLGKRY